MFVCNAYLGFIISFCAKSFHGLLVIAQTAKGDIIGQGDHSRLLRMKSKKSLTYQYVLHKQCIKCAVCKRLLTVGNFVMAERKVYCKAHAKTVAVSS